MAWVYLDDQFPDHPKVAAAGGDAAWLYVCGLAYVKRYTTEGRIPKVQVSKLSDRRSPARIARRLVDVGLWDDGGDHYLVHDYHDWNKPQASRTEAARKAARARWGHAKGTAPPDADAMRDAYEPHSESHSEGIEIAYASECPPPLTPTVELKGGGNSRAAAADAPPPRRCPAHSHIDGPVPPCGSCADARRIHDAWRQEHSGADNGTGDRFDRRLDGQQAAQRATADRHMAELEQRRATPIEPAANVTRLHDVRAALRPKGTA